MSTDEPNVSVQDGEQVSQGFDLDIAGQLREDVSLYLSYAYTDTEVTDSGTGNTEGNAFAGIPKNKLVAWSQWDLSPRWSLAYGLDYQSDSPGDGNNSFDTPARALHELQLQSSWPLDGMIVNADIAVKNLTDEVWYQNNTSAFFIKRGEPRGVYLSLAAEF